MTEQCNCPACLLESGAELKTPPSDATTLDELTVINHDIYCPGCGSFITHIEADEPQFIKGVCDCNTLVLRWNAVAKEPEIAGLGDFA